MVPSFARSSFILFRSFRPWLALMFPHIALQLYSAAGGYLLVTYGQYWCVSSPLLFPFISLRWELICFSPLENLQVLPLPRVVSTFPSSFLSSANVRCAGPEESSPYYPRSSSPLSPFIEIEPDAFSSHVCFSFLYGGVAFAVAAVSLIGILAFANRSITFVRASLFCWPFLLILSCVRAILMIYQLNRRCVSSFLVASRARRLLTTNPSLPFASTERIASRFV